MSRVPVRMWTQREVQRDLLCTSTTSTTSLPPPYCLPIDSFIPSLRYNARPRPTAVANASLRVRALV